MLNTKFSTSDTDSDNSKNHCGNKLKSGWWFNDCSSVNLNGEWSDPNGVFYGGKVFSNSGCSSMLLVVGLPGKLVFFVSYW